MQRDESIQVEAKPTHSEEADTGTGIANESARFSESAFSETCELFHPQPDRDEFFDLGDPNNQT